MAVSLPRTILDGEGFIWDILSDGSISNGTSNAFDTGFDFNFSVSGVTGIAETEDGGAELVLGTFTVGNFQITRKIYVSPESGFIRYVDSITNTAAAAAVFNYGITTNLGSGTLTVASTSSGDAALTAADRWIVTDDSAGFDSAVTIVFRGTGSALALSTATLSSDIVVFGYSLALAAGQTQTIMFFGAQNDTLAAGVTDAQFLLGLGGDALAGLSAAEINSIVNWDLPEIVPLTLTGTAAADVLTGSLAGDTINAGQGDDQAFGDAGRDTINGGAGNDYLDGGADADTMSGNDGNDTVIGGDGGDRLTGNAGNDVIEGGLGADVLFGDDTSGLVTRFAQTTIPSTGENLAISLTLPEAANGTTLNVSGYVSRTPISSSTVNVAFVIDVSGSTNATFVGNTTVGDLNGDGLANTVLDAEIAGYEALFQAITAQAGGNTLNFAVIAFADNGVTFFDGRATADANGNGRADVIDALRSFQYGGGTNYEAGLQEAIRYFLTRPEGQNQLFFLSDGANNFGSAAFADEVATLSNPNGINAIINSYGVGSGASETQLDLLDDGLNNNSAPIILDPSTLGGVLIDPGISQTDIDRVQILVNGVVRLTIDGSDLVTTPFGLRFDFSGTLTGLSATAADTIVARVIAADGASTTVSVSQVVEPLGTAIGDDTLRGGADDDVINGGAGNDSLFGDGGEDLILGEDGIDNLTGGEGSDRLDGGAGNDVLNGGAGADELLGGAGNDTYVVDSRFDRITEALNGGADRVLSSVAWTLSANVENLTLSGIANVAGTGNALNNTIIGNIGNNTLSGNTGADTLRGGAGSDTLSGGLGIDVLSGGVGADFFVFNVAPVLANRDTITDFSVADDTIRLENAVFVGLGATGALGAARFHVGANAADAADRIIYNSTNGQLFFDADGSGAGAKVQFATVTAGLALTSADFIVI